MLRALWAYRFFSPKCADSSEHSCSSAVALLLVHAAEDFKEIRNFEKQHK